MKAKSIGTTFSIDGKAVGALTGIDNVGASSELTDVTTLDSTDGYRDWLGGLKDGNEISLTGFLDSGNEGQKAATEAFEGQDKKKVIVKFPNNVEFSFNAIVTAFSSGAQLSNGVPFNSTVKIVGKPAMNWAAAAAAAEEGK